MAMCVLVRWLHSWFQDARSFQILFLSLFLLLGFATRDWTLKPEMIGVAIATCLIVQTIAQTLAQWSVTKPTAQPFTSAQQLQSLPSAVITSLGLSLLLRADHISTMMLASTIAILSKFVVRVNGKHLFNPANLGIVAALTLTSDAWISPGQWGEEGWYALLFLSAGGLVLQRVGRWDTTAAFLGAYAGLEAIRNIWLGWTWDVWVHRLTSGSLLLFALFMITDPRTIPNARVGRLIWAIALACFTFLLRNIWFIPTAVMWSLVCLAPLTLLLDWVFVADRFTWTKPSTNALDRQLSP